MRRLPASGTLGFIAAAAAWVAAPSDTVTYHRDIAPLLARHCVACHEPGGPAPFPLLAYRDAAGRSKMLLHVTERRLMPPWKADPEYRAFANERRMSAEEIDLLRRWVLAEPPPEIRARRARPDPPRGRAKRRTWC